MKPQYTFDELFSDETRRGTKIPASAYKTKGKYPIIDQGKGTIAGYTDEAEGLFTDVPAILFGDHTRIVKYVDVPFFIGADGVKILSVKKAKDNPKYFFYALKNARIPDTGYNRHFKWLKEQKFLRPAIDEQNSIVERLDATLHLINNTESQLAKLDALVKSRFIEMFGAQNEMDKWTCCNVEDIADVTVGLVIKPTRFYTDDTQNGVKAFRSLNVREMRINDSDWVYFSEEGNEQNKKSQLQRGDVLVVRSGYPGTSCVVTDEYVGCNAIDVMIARPKQDKINPYYLCAFNNFPHGMNQIRHGTGGAAQKHFNVGAYNKVTIPLPPMELQDSFVEFMQLADKSKLAIRNLLEKQELLRAALMQEYCG